MACITVMVGQCGNQLGYDFYTTLAGSATTSTSTAYQHGISSTFFRRSSSRNGQQSPTARCVMVDMEPKVITEIQQRATREGTVSLGQGSVSREEGSANNWAFGYYAQGASRREDAMRLVREEVERADSVACFYVLHSVAGGTGSGVGCLLVDSLREEYPGVPILSVVVWPFRRGEVMTQYINATLALHVLDEQADGVLVLGNDEISEALSAANAGGDMAQTATPRTARFRESRPQAFDALNKAMASQLCALALPMHTQTVLEPDTLFQPLARDKFRQRQERGALGVPLPCSSGLDILRTVAINPRRKFFHAVQNPIPTATTAPLRGAAMEGWRTVVSDALRTTLRHRPEVVSLVLRGPGASDPDEVDVALSSLTTSLGARPVSALHSNMTHVCHNDAPLHSSNLLRTATAFHTRDSFQEELALCATTVESFAASGAFLHHYERFGVERDDVEDALLHVWSLADSYGLPHQEEEE